MCEEKIVNNNIDIANAVVLKKRTVYDFNYTLDSNVFVEDEVSLFKELENIYGIIDVYNNYFIDKYNYKCSPMDLVEHTNLILHAKNGDKLVGCGSDVTQGKKVYLCLMRYMSYLKNKQLFVPTSEKTKYLNFVYTPNVDVHETIIYKKFNELWYDKWGLIDITDKNPITESVCKMIGFMFTPNRSWRYFGVIESPVSGWGKSIFDNIARWALIPNVENLNSTQGVDKHTYNRLYRGNDICIIDDPGKDAKKLVADINNVVANRRGDVREMGVESYTVNGVEVKVIVTMNVPLIASQNVKIDNKMICVKTNTVPDKNDETHLVTAILDEYVMKGGIEKVHEFISGCVDLLASDKTWITRHLGLQADRKELGARITNLLKVEKVQGNYIIDASANTLEQLVRDDLHNDSFSRYTDEQLSVFRSNYVVLCNTLKKHCFDDRCKFYGTLKFMVGNQVADRGRNFKLTDGVKDIIIQAFIACEDGSEIDHVEPNVWTRDDTF